MLIFIAGLMIGGAVGVVIMCLMLVAKEADRHIENRAPRVTHRDEACAAELSDHTGSELVGTSRAHGKLTCLKTSVITQFAARSFVGVGNSFQSIDLVLYVAERSGLLTAAQYHALS